MFADLSRPANKVDNLVEQLKLQINNVKDIVGDHADAHSVLAGTVELVKSVLFEYDSDGLVFKMSNRSERRKLLYHYKKAVVIMNNVAATASQQLRRDDICLSVAPSAHKAPLAAEEESHVNTLSNDVGYLVEQLILQIKNVNDIVDHHDAHSVLAATVERVKSVLSERDSDGLGLKISNKSERSKLMYQYKKATVIMNNVAVTSSQQLQQHDILLDAPASADVTSSSLVEQLKVQINNVNDIVGDHDAHSVLAGTVERVKSVLSERDSLGFKISNKSERRKLMYHYNKAVAILTSVDESKCSAGNYDSENTSARQYFRKDAEQFGVKWDDTFTFHSCAFCLYSGPRSEFSSIDQCDTYKLLLFKLVKEEYYLKLRSSSIPQVRNAADILESQINRDGSYPGYL